jgi:hypothetical protein
MITNAFGVAVPAPNHSQLLERITMFTDEELESIIKFRTNGMSLEQVAKLFVTDRLTIRRAESKYYRLKKEKENA